MVCVLPAPPLLSSSMADESVPCRSESTTELSPRLRTHVEVLAGEIGHRNLFVPGSLARAAEYIRGQWQQQGYRAIAQSFPVGERKAENLEATVSGAGAVEEIILVGAHYDSVYGSPGANDNGSGVAALLELSRLFSEQSLPRSLRFVAFVNEEPPFFQTRQMGSRVYAHMARQRGDNLQGVVILETIGYYRDQPGTQKYPPPLSFFYPDRGNFIGFVSNLSSRTLLKRAADAFRKHSDFPLEQASLPAFLPGVDWSDHSSFWRQGYDAIMVTDTAPYRYPYYHTARDTPDKVNYEALAQVTQGLCAMLTELASTP